MNGLLAWESKTSIELVDAEGKGHAVQRDDIEELVVSAKSIMPEGFEKQLQAAGVGRPAGISHGPRPVRAACRWQKRPRW